MRANSSLTEAGTFTTECPAETHHEWETAHYQRPACSAFWKQDVNTPFDKMYPKYLALHKGELDKRVQPLHEALSTKNLPKYGYGRIGNLHAHLYASYHYRTPDGYGTITGLVPVLDQQYTDDSEYMRIVERNADDVAALVAYRKASGHKPVDQKEFAVYLEQAAPLREGWL